MSHLSNLFGPIDPPPDHVRFQGYTLCRGCSRGQHLDHETPCDCDLHLPEEAA